MLELKKITKIYETGDFIQKALDNVSVCFRKNEFASILGPSGSGKTTLLNIIGGLDQYTSGDLIINEISTKKYKDRDWDTYRNYRVGFVFQSYNLITHQSVLSNVELALTLSGVNKKERKKKSIEVLKKVGLEQHINKKPNQLSGGQMQRVAIARALVNDPDIILADEPTGSLDSETSTQIMELLKEVAKDKLVIMVTHNPELAKEYSTRIVKLKDGKIISDSNPYNKKSSDSLNQSTKSKWTSMSFLTALSLSFNNLMTKKGRTILVSFAGSIGIIGIALILSLSTGFQNFIDDIQEDTLLSYPLTITKETADMTSLLLSMVGNDDSNDKSGVVKEKQYISSMFSNITHNDLKSFKSYLELKEKVLKNDLSSIKYSYSINPQIYTLNSKNELSKLNPSNMFSTIYSSSVTSMYSSYSSIFSQITDDKKIINEQYDVLAGHWPDKYDEMIIVLPEPNSISDLLVYSLGLRDSEELTEMINKIMAGESVENKNKPLEFTYEDLLNIKLKLINQFDTYKYNNQFDVYEDMNADTKYMRALYDKSLELKIVGIVTPKAGKRTMALSPGVGYKKELIDYIIETSSQSEIVKKQLSNLEVDVFSNKEFTDKDNKSDLDFGELISVDTKLLESAFNIKIDQNEIQNQTNDYINNISSSISTNINPAKTDFVLALKTLATNLLIDYTSNPLHSIINPLDVNTKLAVIYINDVDQVIDDYLNSEGKDVLVALEKDYVIPQAVFKDTFKGLLKGLLSGYITNYNLIDPSLTTDINNPAAIITTESIDSSVNTFTSSALIIATTEVMAQKMLEAQMQKNILSNVGELTKYLIESFSNSFAVDKEKIAEAFKFDLSEDQLKRVMSAMMSNEENKNSTSNLISMGYQDKEDPTSISFLFISFDAKENFLKFIDNYNKEVISKKEDAKEIKYTDTTGLLMSSVKDVVSIVSYVLMAFVSISLVVSSIMIAVITFISVLERTKEIGVLRAVGASKKDIRRVFSAETIIEGLTSGLLGIGVTLLLCIPINKIIFNLLNVSNIATLPLYGGIGLIILSILLNMIAGAIPSKMASKKDPVEALRSE